MKGEKFVIELLNEAIRMELTGICQYAIHKGMLENWGYGKLAEKIFGQMKDEMRHLDYYLDRVLFLEGVPVVGPTDTITAGATVKAGLEADVASEHDAVKKYSSFAKRCRENGDIGTAELFEKVLKDEEGHANFLETQLSQIAQIGEQNYLIEQIG